MFAEQQISVQLLDKEISVAKGLGIPERVGG